MAAPRARRAAFVCGIVGLVLGVLATFFWMLVIVLSATGDLDG